MKQNVKIRGGKLALFFGGHGLNFKLVGVCVRLASLVLLSIAEAAVGCHKKTLFSPPKSTKQSGDLEWIVNLLCRYCEGRWRCRGHGWGATLLRFHGRCWTPPESPPPPAGPSLSPVQKKKPHQMQIDFTSKRNCFLGFFFSLGKYIKRLSKRMLAFAGKFHNEPNLTFCQVECACSTVQCFNTFSNTEKKTNQHFLTMTLHLKNMKVKNFLERELYFGDTKCLK